MKYMRTIPVRISTVNNLRFQTDHMDKQCKLRSACTLGIGLIRVCTVAVSSAHCCRTANLVEQGPAVLAAGAGWKLFDFFFFGGGGGGAFVLTEF